MLKNHNSRVNHNSTSYQSRELFVIEGCQGFSDLVSICVTLIKNPLQMLALNEVEVSKVNHYLNESTQI
jgi:hypothetical protein